MLRARSTPQPALLDASRWLLAGALAERDDVELHLTVRQEAAESLAHLVRRPDRLHRLRLPVVGRPFDPLVDRYGRVPEAESAGGAGGGFDVVHGVKHLLPARRSRSDRALRVLTVHDVILLDRPTDFGRANGSGADWVRLIGLRSVGANGITSFAPPTVTSTSMNSAPSVPGSPIRRIRPAPPVGNRWVGRMPTRTGRPSDTAARVASTSIGA